MSDRPERPNLWDPGIAEEVDALISDCMDRRLLLFAFEGRVGVVAARGAADLTPALERRVLRLHNAITQFFYAQAHGYEERHGRPSWVKRLKRA